MTQFCVSGQGDMSAAMKKCPFLHNIAQTHGPEFANSLACKPSCSSSYRPLLSEDYDGGDFSSTFALFHGKGGVLPLPQACEPEPKVLYPLEQPAAVPEVQVPRCPFSSGTPANSASAFVAPLFAAAPLASMSMSWGSNWFNIHHLFQKHVNQHRAHQRKPPQQPQQQQPNGSTLHGGVGGPGLGGPGASASPGASTGSGGKCPLRRALGPLAGVVFNKQGHLSCPEPIVKMRAALAATRPVRELRPQALPVKLLAVAMTTAMLNVPCGMWREHTEKFSSQWFLAVHATIPFIAMLRKAVIMPKYAILFTICSAIAGQAMGARLERRRLLTQATDELGGLAKASAVAAAPRAVPAAAAAAAAAAHPPNRTSAVLPVASLLLAAQQPMDRASAAAAAAATAAAPPPAHPPPLGTDCGAAELGGCSDAAAAAAAAVAAPPGFRSQQAEFQFRVKSPGGVRVGGLSRRGATGGGGARSGGGGGGGARLIVSRDALAAPVPAVAMVPAVKG